MSKPHALARRACLAALTLACLYVLCGLAPTSWSAASLRRSPSSLPSPGAAPAPLSTAAASFVRRLPLPTKDLVVAPNAPTIYASVPSSPGAGRGAGAAPGEEIGRASCRERV